MDIVESVKPLAAILTALIGACLIMLAGRRPNLRETVSFVTAAIMLPFPDAAAQYHPYNAAHISETLQILLFTALGFFLLLKKLKPEPTISLDMDWFYRMQY